MANKASGIIVFFDETQRVDTLVERIEEFDETFSDALSVRDWPIGKRCLSLLSFEEDVISYLALAIKGRRVVTSKDRVEFSSFVDLDRLPISAIQDRIEPRLVQYFIRSSTGAGGTVPPSTWSAIIDAMLKERPSIEREVHRLEGLVKYSGVKIQGGVSELLVQEREALGISLDIFSGGAALRKKVLGEWAPDEASIEVHDEESYTAQMAAPSESTRSFIEGVSQRYFQEESTIQHDLFSWDGAPDAHVSGVSTFNQGRRRLEVIYANRNALEKTLGVDLIYYNQAFNSFVLVQYKLMSEESDGQFIYRPDGQLAKELERMDEFCGGFPDNEKLTNDQDYRLSDDPFLLKLVPNKGLAPSSGELIKGMYLPRRYVHFLLGPHGPTGPLGGQIVSFENARRYLSNTEFSQNINAGRIGSWGKKTGVIKDLIRSYYETGRAVVVARESQREEPEIVSYRDRDVML